MGRHELPIIMMIMIITTTIMTIKQEGLATGGMETHSYTTKGE